MCQTVGVETASHLRDLTLRLYKKAAAYARQRGIIIADTKFEFGRTAKGITLADEVLTPDSSRFWPADKYVPGRPQDSFDQYVRDYLEEIHWNKQPPAPALPADVARRTSEKYLEAYSQLTGCCMDKLAQPDVYSCYATTTASQTGISRRGAPIDRAPAGGRWQTAPLEQPRPVPQT